MQTIRKIHARSAAIVLVMAGVLASVWMAYSRISRDLRQQRLDRELIAAVRRWDTSAEIRLLSKGANANADLGANSPITLKSLLMRSYANRAEGFNDPVLWSVMSSDQDLKAAENSYGAAIEPLLEHGANINASNPFGETLLLLACERNCPSLVQVLIHRGANVNAATPSGYTPLMQAVEFSEPRIVRMLLRSGADTNAKLYSGGTAMTFAVAKGDKGIIQVLEQAGAKR